MKKILMVIGIIIIVIVCIVGIFYARYMSMASNVKEQYAKIAAVELKKIPDGKYIGSFGDFLVFVKLEVEVNKHKITSIRMIEQKCGRGYEALDTIKRIIKAQSPKVDAVTGATGSSMSIMISVDRALKQK